MKGKTVLAQVIKVENHFSFCFVVKKKNQNSH